MGTHVERLPMRRSSSRAPLAVAGVVVLLAALGGGIAIGRATETAPAPAEPVTPTIHGLAAPEAVASVDSMIEAWNAVDEAAVAAAYADDAMFMTVGSSGQITDSVRGADEIAAWAVQFGPEDPWGIERVTEVVASGEIVTFGTTFRCGGDCPSAAVVMFDDEGRIWRQWVVMR